MHDLVHLVISCSDRKALLVPQPLRLGALGSCSELDRAKAWMLRLATYPCPAWPALDLYAGDHASVARAIQAGPRPVAIWVASAGYGLIPGSAEIKPYSATFASNQPDSVGGGATGGRDWWARLATWPGPVAGQPRTLRQLRSAVEGPLLVALGARYLAAVQDDLRDAAALGIGPILTLSAGVRAFQCPGVDFLPSNGSMQRSVGGARASLNVRLARFLVETSSAHNFRPSAMAQTLSELDYMPMTTPPSRHRLSDTEVRSWLRSRIGSASRSRLLRELRDQGLACEQARFSRIYREVMT